MKKAITIYEMILVVAITSILAFAIFPRLYTDTLQEAADQILSHIRYAQHLAIVDDRFNPNDENWSKSRWMIRFNLCNNGDWYYVVGRDIEKNNGIGKDEAAINPADGKKIYTDNSCELSEDESTEILLTNKFDIKNINFSNSCGTNQYIAFDYSGRAYASIWYNGKPNAKKMYNIIKDDCNITFISDYGTFVITIEPESGFAYLSSIYD